MESVYLSLRMDSAEKLAEDKTDYLSQIPNLILQDDLEPFLDQEVVRGYRRDKLSSFVPRVRKFEPTGETYDIL